MIVLTQRMREERVRRNYAQTTIRSYLMAIEEFRREAEKRLDHIAPEDIRRYQVALLEDKKLAVGTVALRVSALRSFYLRVLKKRALKDELPYPKNPKWARRLSAAYITRLVTTMTIRSGVTLPDACACRPARGAASAVHVSAPRSGRRPLEIGLAVHQ